MQAFVISEAEGCVLNPLTYNQKLSELPIMGEPFYIQQQNIFSKHNIELVKTIQQLQEEDPIVAIESNIISDVNINDAVRIHKKQNADLTVIVRQSSDTPQSRRVVLNKDNTLCFPPQKDEYAFILKYELEGIYIISRSFLSYMADNLQNLCGEAIIQYGINLNLKIVGYISDRYSITVSDINTYQKCHMDALLGISPIKLSSFQIKKGIWLENGACLESGTRLETPAYISRGCTIERDAEIGGYTFIAPNCTIKSGAVISHSIIGNNCYIGEMSKIDGSVLCEDISIGNKSIIMDKTIIGKGCRIEQQCVVNSGVKIWPNKRVLKGTRLNDNLIWGSVGTEHLFCNGKIGDAVNVELTPDFTAKLGSAIGTFYHGKKIGIAFESSPVCSSLCKALCSGLSLSGTKIYNFGELILPATRLGLIFYKLDVAIQIKMNELNYPELEFIEQDGTLYSEEHCKAIENLYFNNVFLQATSKNMQDITDVKGYKSIYIQDILNNLKSSRFTKNMELRTRSEGVSEILEILLREIELKSDASSEKEFSADIDMSGQKTTIYSSNGMQIPEHYFLSVIVMVLLEHFGAKKVVLPSTAPEGLEKYIIKTGATIIKCGASERELMNTLINNKLYTQFRLCFDAIYSCVFLLDYLNSNNMTFGELKERFPDCCHYETEVECPTSRKKTILESLHSKYNDKSIDYSDGIKIYQNNGWVLVIPDKQKHFVKIITEGTNMETASEIGAIFANQIKKLAKPQ